MPGPSVMVRIMGDAKNFTASVEQASSASSKLESALSTAGRTAASAGGALIEGIGKAASTVANVLGGATLAVTGFAAANTQTYVKAQQFENALELVGKQMGVSNETIQAGIGRMTRLGASTQSAREVMMTFVRSGMDASKAWELYARAEDIAVTTGKTGNQVIQELIHGLQTGNTNLGIFREINFNATKAQDDFAKSIGKTRAQLTETEKQQALFNGVMEATGNIAGVAGKMMAEGPFNWAAMQAPIANLREAVGGFLEPAFSSVGRAVFTFTTTLTQAISKGGKFYPIVDAIRKAAAKLVEPLTRVVERMTAWINNLKPDSFTKITAAIEKFAPLIASAAAGLATFAGGNVLKNIPVVGQMLGNLGGPIGAIAVGLGTLLLTGQDVGKSVEKLGGQITDWIGKLSSSLAKQLPGILDGLVKAITKAAPLVVTAFVELLRGLGQALPSLVKAVGEVVPPLIRELGRAIVEAIPIISRAFVDLLRGITQALPDIIAALAEVVPAMIMGLSAAIVENVPLIVQAFTTLLTSITAALPALLSALVAAIPPVIMAIIEALPQIIRAITDFLTTNLPVIIQAGVDLLSALVQNIPAIIEAIRPAIPQLIDAIVSALTTNIPIIIQAGVDLLTALIEAIPQVIEAIYPQIPKIIQAIVGVLVGPPGRGAIPQIIDAGIQLLSAIIENIPQIVDAITPQIPRIVDAIVGALVGPPGNGLIPTIAQAGIDLLVALIDKLPEIIDTLVKAIPQIVDGLVGALVGPPGEGAIPKIVQAGFDLLTSLTDKTDEIIDSLVKTVPQIVNGLAAGFGKVDMHQIMTEAGKSLLMSVIKGLTGGGGGDDAERAGKNITSRFSSGITAGIPGVDSAVSSVLSRVRNMLPFSPAKTGPFSGAGWRQLAQSGANIVEQVASGMLASTAVTDAMTRSLDFRAADLPTPHGGDIRDGAISRTGATVVVENVTLTDGADIDLFLQRAVFAAESAL